MATTNPKVGTDWTLLVTAGDAFTVGPLSRQHRQVEIAATDANSAPAIQGDPIESPEEKLNRDLVGPGYVWGRSLTGHPVTLVLHAWTP